MAGGKSREKSGRYLVSPGSNNSRNSRNVCRSDRRLVPRIKEYLKQQEDSAEVELDDLVVGLKSTYREYARKGHAFKIMVGQLFQSLQLPARDGEEGEGETWLEQREREHFERRLKEAEEEQTNQLVTSPVSTSEDEEDDDMDISLNPEELNVVNNMLLAMYDTDNSTAPTSSSGVGWDMNSSEDPLDLSTIPAAPSHVRELSDVSPPAPLLGESQNFEPALGSAESAHDAESREQRAQSAVVSESSKLVWQVLNKTPERTPTGATTPTQQATPTTLLSSAKKVTFSTPEVTEQHRFDVSEEERAGGSWSHSKAKKLKKRHRHHSHEEEGKEEVEEDSTKVKRRRKSKETVGSGSGGEGSKQQKSNEDFRVQSSSIKFSDMGGCERTLQEIQKLLLHFRHPEVFSRLGVSPPLGFLLHGPPGCGKTLLAHAIAGELALPFIKLAATEVVSGVSGESEGTIRDLFSLAKSHAPCVLFIDEVDAICRKRETAQREMERRIVTQLLSCMDDLNTSDSAARVLVIGATNSPDSLDPGLRRAGRFDREICLGIPDQPARESILEVLGRGLRLESGFSFRSISQETPGFVGADLQALVREASLCAVNRIFSESSSSGSQTAMPAGVDQVGVAGGRSLEASNAAKAEEHSPFSEEQLSKVYITDRDFVEALRVVQPSAKREGFATVPDVTWEDVGALESVREELSYAILAPVRYPHEFASLGLTTPPGVLLSGPPGCGKTLLAKAIANESGINFISVKGPELLNMYVGESERAVRQVFQRATNSAPCVIFFDELDALCPKRSEAAEGNASSRVVNQLLTEMDGLVARKQVFIMGATNRPDIIDPAVLRPGRLDKILYVGLPTAEDRVAILNTITKSGSRPKLAADVDLNQLASDKHTGGYSGADLSALVREAAVTALRECVQLQPLGSRRRDDADSDQSEGRNGADSDQSERRNGADSDQSEAVTVSHDSANVEVGMKHFLVALVKIKPSVSEKDRVRYEQMATRCSTL